MTGPIIGIGCARSGTTSLARLLQAWGLNVCHEGKPPNGPWTRIIPSQCWRPDDSRRGTQYQQAVHGFQRKGIDGDVACWHVQVIDDLLQDFPDARVITLIRPRADLVESCLQHFRAYRLRTNRYWGGSTFPTYPEATHSAKEGWGAYWDAVYEAITQVEGHHRHTFRLGTYDIEDVEAQAQLAAFLGVSDWHHVADCHHNKQDSEKTSV